DGVETRTVVEWFDLGGSLPLSDLTPARDVIAQTRGIGGLADLAQRAGVGPDPTPAHLAAAIDFVLEGLCAQRKISRSDERGYSAAAEQAPRRGPRREESSLEEEIRIPGAKKKYYN